jgi:uncharacterized protein YaaN involved in tellurite resistance
VAIKAIQEQQEIINALKETIKIQQQTTEKLIKRIESLEKSNYTFLNKQTK